MKYLVILFIVALAACSAKVVEKSNPMDLQKQIRKGQNILLKDQTIDVELDFTKLGERIQLNRASEQINISSNLYFENCTFTKPVKGYARNKDFSEMITSFNGVVTFYNCRFEEEVNLKYATFSEQVDLSNSTFKKKTNFQDATFVQRVNARGAFWQDEAHFQNARFFHKSNFMDTKFNGHLMFQSANFRDETNFSNSECLKYVDFSLVKFDGTASFNYIKWKDRAVFNNAVWLMTANFVDPKVGSLSFKNSDARSKFLLSGEEVSGELIRE